MSAHTHEHYITPAWTLIATFVALVALTLLTSALAQVNLGRADIWVTLGIATVKAALVALIFMQLAHDKAFNGVVLLGTLIFMGIFVSITLMDTSQYQDSIEAYTEDELQTKAEMAPAPAAEPAPETTPTT